MKNLVEKIITRQYDEAASILNEEIGSIVRRKLNEMKKMCAARMEQNTHAERMKRLRMDVLEDEDMDTKLNKQTNMQEEDYRHSKGDSVRVSHKGKMVSGKIVRHEKGSKQDPESYVVDVGEPESIKVPAHKINEEEQLDEGRIAVVKARIRGGKIQRRKKVSNVPGMTLRGGQLVRMTPAERRARKMGARKAARKSRQKQAQAMRKRKLSLMKRKRLGI